MIGHNMQNVWESGREREKLANFRMEIKPWARLSFILGKVYHTWAIRLDLPSYGMLRWIDSLRSHTFPNEKRPCIQFKRNIRVVRTQIELSGRIHRETTFQAFSNYRFRGSD